MFFLKQEIRALHRRLTEILKTDTNAHLTTATTDQDVAALAVSINALLDEVRQAEFQKNRAEADLKRAVTNISHDLRTPLTAALGYLQLLESADMDADTRAAYLDTVRGRLLSLSTLMDSLFEFARVSEGGQAYTIEKVNVLDLLRNVLAASYTELAARGITVHADIPDSPLYCMADRDALQRILQNLIKNVYQHGREELHVRVHGPVLELANKAVDVETLDAERIFERFYTADMSRTGKNTGLGLAIAAELARHMGGHLTAAVEGGMLVMRLRMSCG